MSEHNETLDEIYLRWLTTPEMTLGTPVRMQIALRYKELLNAAKQVAPMPVLGQANVPKQSRSKGHREVDGGKGKTDKKQAKRKAS